MRSMIRGPTFLVERNSETNTFYEMYNRNSLCRIHQQNDKGAKLSDAFLCDWEELGGVWSG